MKEHFALNGTRNPENSESLVSEYLNESPLKGTGIWSWPELRFFLGE